MSPDGFVLIWFFFVFLNNLNSPCYETRKNAIKKKKATLFVMLRQMYVSFVIWFSRRPCKTGTAMPGQPTQGGWKNNDARRPDVHLRKLAKKVRTSSVLS
jgi:hypothetical protein